MNNGNLFRYSKTSRIIRRNWNYKTFKELVDKPFHSILIYKKRRKCYLASDFLSGYMSV